MATFADCSVARSAEQFAGRSGTEPQTGNRRLAPPIMRASAEPHVQRHRLRTVAPRIHGDARALPRVMPHRVNAHSAIIAGSLPMPTLPDRSLRDATVAGVDRPTQ